MSSIHVRCLCCTTMWVFALGLAACGNEVSSSGIDSLDLASGRAPAGDDDGPPQGPDLDAPVGGDTTLTPDADPPGGDVDPGPQLAPVFVAQGHAGRLLMSCDDGRTWTHDQNDEPTIECFNPTDCDHRADSAAGLTFADGYFFAAFGHGSPDGTLRRSTDGITWTPMMTGDSQGGIYFHDGLLLWMQGQFGISDDLGVTVENNLAHVPGGYYLARTIAAAGDVIVASGDDAGGLVSRDNGQTWVAATLTDVAWGRNVIMAEAPDGSLITVSAVHGTPQTTAYAARSTDGGLTWVGNDEPLYAGEHYVGWSMMVRDGNRLVGFFDDAMWTSDDGIAWTSTPLVTHPAAGNLTDGAIAMSDGGTFVTITSAWANFYDKQHAYRSSDGLNWTLLDGAHFTGGHPVGHIVSGYVDPSVCP